MPTDYVTKLEQLEQRLRAMLSSHKRGDSLDAMAKLFGQIQQTRRQLLLERGEETVMHMKAGETVTRDF